MRKLRPNQPSADSHVTIYLLAGTHYLPSTINMNKRDSHIAIKPLNEDDEVTLSGGMILDGEWAEGEGGVRTATFQAWLPDGYSQILRLCVFLALRA